MSKTPTPVVLETLGILARLEKNLAKFELLREDGEVDTLADLWHGQLNQIRTHIVHFAIKEGKDDG